MRKLLTQRLTRTDIIAPDVSYDFGVCLEHLLMRAEAPTQAREVDDDHAFRHDGRRSLRAADVSMPAGKMSLGAVETHLGASGSP
jgi:hypothetical protein